MKILVLCRNLRLAGGRVVGTNFVKALRTSGHDHRYLIVAPPNAGYEEITLPSGSEMVIFQGGSNPISQWSFDTFSLPKVARHFAADVVFAMGNIGLVDPPCPQAILFHKPQLVYPIAHYARETRKARFINWLYKKRLRRCLKSTQLVFCQTPVARDRFHRTFNYPEEHIQIMPNAVSGFFAGGKEPAQAPAVFSKHKAFNMLFLTKFYAHKNIEVLIELFNNHRDKLQDVRCLVTIAADQHPNASGFLSDIERHGLQNHIINVGPLKHEDLAGYFTHSDALLFPTLLESFSGTYLEAMHFGLPILTSRLDFAEDVCGDAALYFDPWDPGDMLDKIQTLRNNAKLKEDLVSKGRERMKRFFKSWDQITAETVQELEKLAGVRRQ